MADLIPTNDNLLVRDDDPATISPGGVHLPDQAPLTRARRGTVLGVGPGRLLPDLTRSEMSVEVGDVIAYDGLSGTEIKTKGVSYVLVAERSVLAVFPEAEA